MNERIRELARQIGPIATIGNWGRVEWSDNVYPQLGDRLYAAIDIEEFAELIVRECMRMCEVAEMSFKTHECDVEASGAITVKQFIEDWFEIDDKDRGHKDAIIEHFENTALNTKCSLSWGIICDYFEAFKASTDNNVREHLIDQIFGHLKKYFPVPTITSSIYKDTKKILDTQWDVWSIDRLRTKPPYNVTPEVFPIFVCRYTFTVLKPRLSMESLLKSDNFNWFSSTYGKIMEITMFGKFYDNRKI